MNELEGMFRELRVLCEGVAKMCELCVRWRKGDVESLPSPLYEDGHRVAGFESSDE